MAATGQSYTADRAAIYRLTADTELPMTRRVFGLKTWYTAAFEGGQEQLADRLPGERRSALPASR
jgi:hypothetical protein